MMDRGVSYGKDERIGVEPDPFKGVTPSVLNACTAFNILVLWEKFKRLRLMACKILT